MQNFNIDDENEELYESLLLRAFKPEVCWSKKGQDVVPLPPCKDNDGNELFHVAILDFELVVTQKKDGRILVSK